MRANNPGDDVDDATPEESRQNDMIHETRHEHDRAYSSVEIDLETDINNSHTFY